MRSGASSGAVAWAPFTWRVIFASTDLLINLSLNVRFTLGTKAEVVQTESREPTRRSLGTLVMVASGLSLLGVSFLLLARARSGCHRVSDYSASAGLGHRAAGS